MSIFFSPSLVAFYDSEINTVIPNDAVEITRERHAELFLLQSQGLEIVADHDGSPIAVAPKQSANAETTRQIVQLEEQVTPRRLREAVLGIDNGWLATLNSKIAALRESLK